MLFLFADISKPNDNRQIMTTHNNVLVCHTGATYFFKNRDFWKFNDLRMRVEQKEPRSIGEFWFNCTAVDGDRWPVTKNRGRTAGRGGRFQAVDDGPSGSGGDVSSSYDHTQPPIVAWSMTMASIVAVLQWVRWTSPRKNHTCSSYVYIIW